MQFIDEIHEFEEYYNREMAPIPEGEMVPSDSEGFDPAVYNALVRKLLINGLRFKVNNNKLLNERQYSTYLGLISGRNNMSEDKMYSISEMLPTLYRITKVMEEFNKEDAACLIYLLNPSK